MKMLANTYGYGLFLANESEIITGHAAACQIDLKHALDEILRRGGKYGNPIEAAEVWKEKDRYSAFCGMCLNTDRVSADCVTVCLDLFEACTAAGSRKGLYYDDPNISPLAERLFKESSAAYMVFNTVFAQIRKAHAKQRERKGRTGARAAG